MNCPRCRTFGNEVELKQISISEILIDVCDECGGIWFDKQELGQAIQTSKEEIQKLTETLSNAIEFDKTKDVEMNCPKCNDKMFKYRYMYTSNIYIDGCDKCEGVWIDKGELLEIINYLEEASKVDPEKEQMLLAKLQQIKLEYEQKEKEFIDSLVKLDDKAKSPISRAFGEILQSIYTFMYKKGL
ncbi:MAG: zf-TFIIB domain-containing protein [Candidatus Calescibacterium sp.]|nr:zf-TFIIB domain-containing protein [Candidatus Calescibacterium sp.]MDW8195336.1 zf-TFIIB domain-containing protein [Candidatus Calescibacterium sp.]